MIERISLEEFKRLKGESAQAFSPAKAHKYGAIRTEVDGISFASKAEARHYQQLKLMEKGRAIHSLVLQPKFPLEVNGKKICTYIADFSYIVSDTGEFVVVDVKGVKTDIYLLKKKMVDAILGIKITEVS
jgi:hypothetical protein